MTRNFKIFKFYAQAAWRLAAQEVKRDDTLAYYHPSSSTKIK